MTKQLRAAIYECYCWKFSNTGCFTNRLFDLMCKADLGNLRRLKTAFPDEYEAWNLWRNNGQEWLKAQVNSDDKLWKNISELKSEDE